MAMKVNINLEKVQEFLDMLQETDILTDYHGSYPVSLTIGIGWQTVVEAEPRPVPTGVTIGFASS